MNRELTSYEAMRDARTALMGQILGSLAAMVVLHLIAPVFHNDPFTRFVLMIAWFGCLATVTWSLTEPLTGYIRRLYGWRFSEAGPAINHTAGRLVIRQCRFFTGLGWLLTALVTLCALYVVSFWLDGQGIPKDSGWFLRWAWIVSMAGVPLYVFIMAGTIKEIIELRRELAEQSELSGATVKTAADAARHEQANANATPVVVTAPMRFQAGGYEWNYADFYKNAVVFGMVGSGKTVTVMNSILEGLIASSGAARKPCAGLILDPKGDFHNKIAALCRKYGRTGDLLVIDPAIPDRSARYNPFDSDDDPLELANRFAGVMETISDKSSEDAYWRDNVKKFVQNAITLLRAAHPGVPPSLVDIYECATDDDRIVNAYRAVPSELFDSKGVRRACAYVRDEWVPMDEKPKGTIRSFLTNMLTPFLLEPYDEIFAGRSTRRLGEVLDEGKLLYVNMPIADKTTMARVICTFVKLEFYREVMKRLDKERPSFFLCDEFQSFFTATSDRGDADAFAVTRQSNHANIIAFQNIQSLLKQAPKPEVVKNMLGNCATKLFLRNTDHETNEYASTLFGQQIESLVGTSQSFAGGAAAGAGRTMSENLQYAKRIKEDVFTTLAVPSREDSVFYSEAMVHLGARVEVAHERQRWRVNPLV